MVSWRRLRSQIGAVSAFPQIKKGMKQEGEPHPMRNCERGMARQWGCLLKSSIMLLAFGGLTGRFARGAMQDSPYMCAEFSGQTCTNALSCSCFGNICTEVARAAFPTPYIGGTDGPTCYHCLEILCTKVCYCPTQGDPCNPVTPLSCSQPSWTTCTNIENPPNKYWRECTAVDSCEGGSSYCTSS